MPRVHYVKKARKSYRAHGIKKGDSYYWWKPRVGGRGGVKRFSKTPPRPSQVTQSEFLSAVLAAEESVADAVGEFNKLTEGGYDDLAAALEQAAEEVREAGESCREKFDNMPDSLQQGETGQLLEQRADRCEEVADELEQAASEVRECDPGDAGEEGAEEAAREAGELADDEAADDKRQEAVDAAEGVSWNF